jgi:hypothetical protein
MKRLLSIAGMCFSFLILPGIVEAQSDKPRVIVTTDGEVDDKTSFIRYLMYSNEFETEGLIYGNSMWQKHGHGTVWMQETIDLWTKYLDNILLHQEGYPSPESLKAVCYAGNMEEKYLNHSGPLESEGARHIIKVLLDENPKPVWVQAWGGTNTIGQTLSILDEEYSEADIKKAHTKLRIYAIADQDETAKWIRQEYPHIFYIQCHQFMALNYSHKGHPYSDHDIFSDDWTTRNVKQGHGELGVLYPQRYFSEGDSPSFFYLIGTGLQAEEHPSWGSWGGRFVKHGDSKYFSDAHDGGDKLHGQWIWLLDIQNDFAARMDWCVESYKEANHYPKIRGKLPEILNVDPGEEVKLKAKGISDPDKDEISLKWWHYQYAGDNPYASQIEIKENTKSKISFTVPEDAAGKEIHIILEVADDGDPVLKRYRRVVLKVST